MSPEPRHTAIYPRAVGDVSANSALEESWDSALGCRCLSCAVVAVFFLNEAELERVFLIRLH